MPESALVFTGTNRPRQLSRSLSEFVASRTYLNGWEIDVVAVCACVRPLR
ncbi:MAG: hypothetical protein ABI583_12430 [Betaproteobacteria bacterium]